MSKHKCLECGTLMKTTRENHKYDASGLPGVVLANVEVHRCPECGEQEVQIPHIQGLHRTLAMTLARKHERLAAAEIKFLRKYLGLAGNDFAQLIGVAPETVSRWEQGRTPMGPTADRFLRWLAVTREPVSHYPLEILKEVAQAQPKPFRAEFTISEGGWHQARVLAHA